MSAFHPFATDASVCNGILGPPSMVAQADATPTSASTDVARMGMVTVELTSYGVSLDVGDVTEIEGGFGSTRMLTLFCCATECVG